MQFVETELQPDVPVNVEAGRPMMMVSNLRTGMMMVEESGSKNGFMDKMIGAGKRVLTGESLFMTTFTNDGTGKKHVSFASPYPGKIIPVDLQATGGKLICQKDAFLAAAKGVSVGIEF